MFNQFKWLFQNSVIWIQPPYKEVKWCKLTPLDLHIRRSISTRFWLIVMLKPLFEASNNFFLQFHLNMEVKWCQLTPLEVEFDLRLTVPPHFADGDILGWPPPRFSKTKEKSVILFWHNWVANQLTFSPFLKNTFFVLFYKMVCLNDMYQWYHTAFNWPTI